MATILIRQLPEETKVRLRLWAAQRGHSMEREAREILERALLSESSANEHLVDGIRRRMEPVGAVDLPTFPRSPVPEPPALTE